MDITMHILAAIAISSIIASISDWLFMGVLFHDRYQAHPEVWREERSRGQRILISQVVGIAACAGFVGICYMYPSHLRFYLKAAVFVWLAGALPMLIQNGVWMKLHPLVLGSHAAGWLVRLLITALVCSFLI